MNAKMGTILAVAGSMALSLVAPMAHADSTQSNKNLWRNLAIGGAVVAGHGLVTHNGTETLIGAAGAAYSANRYEEERRSQSRQRQRERYYYRHHHHYHND
jgi:predicted dienelactone hydrolase